MGTIYDRRRTPEHFVIVVGRKGAEDSSIDLVTATSPLQAVEFCKQNYIRQRGLAPSVHVTTRIVFRSESEPEAQFFFARFYAALQAGTDLDGKPLPKVESES